MMQSDAGVRPPVLPELDPEGQVPFQQQGVGPGEDMPGGRNGMNKTCLRRKDKANVQVE